MKASSGPAPTAGGSPRQETFHRRTLLLGVASAAGMGALVLRNAQLGLIDHSRFRRMADGNAYSERLIPSPRGLLLDRNGVRLAENRPSFRVLVSPEETPDLEQALDLLERMLPGAVAPRRAALLRKARLSTSTPLLVSDDLTWEAFARVNLQLGDLPGVIVDMTQVRSYPHGGVFAHVAGYVAKASQRDFDAVLKAGRRPPSIMHDPAFRIGRQGVEKALDEALRGEAGVERVKVNAHGKVIARNLPGSRPPRPGADVRLTLDADVQRTALESFGEESGGCALIDVESGDLLCLASSPAFDPNLFVTGVPGSVYRAWAEYEQKPLLDKACGGVFHPGSTFKLATGLALMESGVDPTETVVCTGGYAYGGRVFRCWNHSGHGRVDLEAALKTSCDVYFYHLCNRAGVDRIAEVAHRLGLGERFEIEAPGQRSGVIPTAAWKAHYNRAHADPSTRRWYPGETLSVAIGQGDVAVSALQLAVMTARIANGRQAVTPRLVAAIGGSPLPRPRFAELGFSPAHIDQVRRGMYAVSNDPGGGAFRQSRLGLGDIRIAGKTGTAQVRSYGAGPRTSDIWRLKDHNLFVAYAPSDRPRYAVSVIVEHGGRGGATAAAPRALEVLRTALIKDPQIQARLTQPAP